MSCSFKEELVLFLNTEKLQIFRALRIGARAERLKGECKHGEFKKRIFEESGKPYRFFQKYRRLYRVALEEVQGIDAFMQDVPVTEPEKLTPMLQMIQAWAGCDTLAGVLETKGIRNNAIEYSSVNKSYWEAYKELAEAVTDCIEQCPLPVRQAWEHLPKKKSDAA